MRSEPYCRRILWLAVVTHALLWGFLTSSWYRLIQLGTWDTAIYGQVLWLIGQGDPSPFVTLLNLPLWGNHVDWILLLLAPLHRLMGERVVWLWWAHVLCVSGGALLLYRYALLRWEQPAAALLVALAWLWYYPWHRFLVWDFRPLDLAIPLLLALAVWEAAGRWQWWAIGVSLLLGTKEMTGLTLAAWGLRWLTQRRWWAGVGLMAGGFLYWLAAVRWVIPHFLGAPYLFTSLFYGWLGRDLGEMLQRMLLHPLWVWEQCWVPENYEFLILTTMPLLGLCLLAPRWLLPALPMMVAFWLDRGAMGHIDRHVGILIYPFFFLGAIDGWRGLGALLSRPPQRWLLGGAALILWGCLLTQALFYPPWGTMGEAYRMLVVAWSEPKPELPIPPASEGVAAMGYVLPHLSQRRDLFLLPMPFYAWRLHPHELGRGLPPRDEELAKRIEERPVEWVYLDRRFPWPLSSQDLERLAGLLRESAAYREVGRYCQGQVLVFRAVSQGG